MILVKLLSFHRTLEQKFLATSLFEKFVCQINMSTHILGVYLIYFATKRFQVHFSVFCVQCAMWSVLCAVCVVLMVVTKSSVGD